MPKEYIELFSNGIAMQMIDYKDLNIFHNGKKSRIKNSSQDKGFMEEFEAFKNAIKTGQPAISFESIYNTTKSTFKILESIKSSTAVIVDE